MTKLNKFSILLLPISLLFLMGTDSWHDAGNAQIDGNLTVNGTATIATLVVSTGVTLPASGVTAGTYNLPSLTVNAAGLITSASSFSGGLANFNAVYSSSTTITYGSLEDLGTAGALNVEIESGGLLVAQQRMQAVSGLSEGSVQDVADSFSSTLSWKNWIIYSDDLSPNNSSGNDAGWFVHANNNTLTYASDSPGIAGFNPPSTLATVTVNMGAIVCTDGATLCSAGGSDYREQMDHTQTDVSDLRSKTVTFSVWLRFGSAPGNPTLKVARYNDSDSHSNTCAVTIGSWTRCSLTATFNSTSLTDNSELRVYILPNVAGNTLFMWGAQLELNSVATPYQENDSHAGPGANSYVNSLLSSFSSGGGTTTGYTLPSVWGAAIGIGNTMQDPCTGVAADGSLFVTNVPSVCSTSSVQIVSPLKVTNTNFSVNPTTSRTTVERLNISPSQGLGRVGWQGTGGAIMNDWSPTGLASHTRLMVNGSDNQGTLITGIDSSNMSDGDVIWICNDSAPQDDGIIQLSNEDTRSLLNNRIYVPDTGVPGQGNFSSYAIPSKSCVPLMFAVPDPVNSPSTFAWMLLVPSSRQAKLVNQFYGIFPETRFNNAQGSYNDLRFANSVVGLPGMLPYATTVAVGSNNQTTPGGSTTFTLNVGSTSGFTGPGGSTTLIPIVVNAHTGGYTGFLCTGMTSTTFTGCTGGVVTFATNDVVQGGICDGGTQCISDDYESWVITTATSSAVTFTGLYWSGNAAPDGLGPVRVIVNAGPGAIILANQSASSAAGNKFSFATSGNVTIPSGGVLTVYHPGIYMGAWIPMGPLPYVSGSNIAVNSDNSINISMSSTSCATGQAATSQSTLGVISCGATTFSGTNTTVSSGTVNVVASPSFTNVTASGTVSMQQQNINPRYVPASLTGGSTNNDYNPTAVGGQTINNTTFVALQSTTSSQVTLTGLNAGSTGDILTFCDFGPADIKFTNNDSGSLSANRMFLPNGQAVTLRGTSGSDIGGCITLRYGGANWVALNVSQNDTPVYTHTVTQNASQVVFSAVGTGLSRDGTNNYQVDLNINGGTTQTCTSGQFVTALTGVGLTTCATAFNTAGTGLTNSGSTVSLNINSGTTQTCSAGQSVTALTGVGITTCSTFVNAAGTNLSLSGSTLSLSSTPNVSGSSSLLKTQNFDVGPAVTPSTLTSGSTTSDWNPTGCTTVSNNCTPLNSWIRVTTSGNTTAIVDGMVGPGAGTNQGLRSTLCNFGSGAVRFVNTTASASSAGNKFQLPLTLTSTSGTYTLPYSSCITFIYDNNGIWMPESVGVADTATQFSAVPTLTSCGGGTPTITGTNVAGTVTEGTTATGCTVTFSTSGWDTVDGVACVVSSHTGGTPVAISSEAVTAFTVTNSSTSGLVFDYICNGYKSN